MIMQKTLIKTKWMLTVMDAGAIFKSVSLIFHSVQAPRRPNKSSCTVSQLVLAGDYLPGWGCRSLLALDSQCWANVITFTSAENFDSSCTRSTR